MLEPVGPESVAGVVHCLGALPAQPDAAAELAVRTRRSRSRAGDVDRALAEGRLGLGEKRRETDDCEQGKLPGKVHGQGGFTNETGKRP